VCLDPKGGGKLIDNFGVAAELDTPLHLETGFGTLQLVTGTLLGAILTTGSAKLWVMEFNGSAGTQTVTECLEGKGVKTHTLKSETNENGKAEALSINVVGGLLQFKEEVKLEDS
jgi:hypothetical protein